MPGVFVGLDVSKDAVAVAVTPSGAALTAETTAAGLKALVRKRQKLAPTLVVLEATGGYEIPVLAALCDAELPVSLVQPLRVRRYAQSQGQSSERSSRGPRNSRRPRPEPITSSTRLLWPCGCRLLRRLMLGEP